eukprot:CAMPEP_0185778182 /NCGR_PEP_ID=MMETSP1174-20130828/91796_1 /TAXON_ID=35687 /ORGANISM="Dictyocha speculum, Strain CCMP1381" /LENGTH=62 /DNA_ID=CAMNT_0028466805 /DNA_START=496 /DNA_END=684 /DNA_ORIENTATION=-
MYERHVGSYLDWTIASNKGLVFGGDAGHMENSSSLYSLASLPGLFSQAFFVPLLRDKHVPSK